jgi:hypothetical protein
MGVRKRHAIPIKAHFKDVSGAGSRRSREGAHESKLHREMAGQSSGTRMGAAFIRISSC